MPAIYRLSMRNDTTFKTELIERDRDRDLLAEFTRRNALNGILDYVMYSGRRVHQYFRNICKFNKYTEAYAIYFYAIVLTAFSVILAASFIILTRKMNAFYSKLFRVRVTTVH